MGVSSSTDQVSAEQHEIEQLAASTGSLPMLQNVFAKLADPDSNAIPLSSLQQCFSVSAQNILGETSVILDSFPKMMDHLDSSIVDLFFEAEGGGINWIQLLRGYIKCCGRASGSASLNNLLRVFDVTAVKADLPSKLQFELGDSESKVGGFLMPVDVLMLLWMCWSMSWDSRSSKSAEMKANFNLPDVSSLVLSAVVSCTEDDIDIDVWDCDVPSLDVQIPSGKFQIWALKTVPSLPDCLAQFVHAKLQNSLTSEDKAEQSSVIVSDSSVTVSNNQLLTRGMAWAISLSLRSYMREEILKACFPVNGDETNDNLLYQSSHHGKGLNRFWSNIEGYNGPMLLLLSANMEDGNGNVRRWVVGALTMQGFENKDTFYGSSGSLYSTSPVFHVFPAYGKEKNFVYTHLHPTSSAYDPHPKPEGIAFGGSIGNERIFIDEDFAKVTIRHHAVDKTYQHGSFFPNQGYLPIEASILGIEVWGLGGSKAMETQTSHQRREELFTQQRRKIDLKTFSNWEDSPEKMMMDMMSNPNAVRREER